MSLLVLITTLAYVLMDSFCACLNNNYPFKRSYSSAHGLRVKINANVNNLFVVSSPLIGYDTKINLNIKC